MSKSPKWRETDITEFERLFYEGKQQAEIHDLLPRYERKQINWRYDQIKYAGIVVMVKKNALTSDPRKFDFTMDNVETRN